MATKYAAIHHYEVDATQELVGSGLAIFVGVFFNCFVVAGGLARSAVNAESGAMTQMTSCFVAIFMILALLTLTSLFYYIPMAVLAAVIEVSIISMLDFASMVKAYQIDRRDCLVMVLTFLITFFVGVTEGLFVGIGISIALVLKTTAFPHMVLLGQLPQDPQVFRDIQRYPETVQIPGYAIIRMDASPYFANCASFKGFVEKVMDGKHRSSSSKSIHTVILDASPWVDIDLMGIQTLFELRESLKKRRRPKSLLIACAKGKIRDRLRKSHFVDAEGLNHAFYASIDDAIQRRLPRLSITSLQAHSPMDMESTPCDPLLAGSVAAAVDIHQMKPYEHSSQR